MPSTYDTIVLYGKILALQTFSAHYTAYVHCASLKQYIKASIFSSWYRPIHPVHQKSSTTSDIVELASAESSDPENV
jgi:hypothetical protein